MKRSYFLLTTSLILLTLASLIVLIAKRSATDPQPVAGPLKPRGIPPSRRVSTRPRVPTNNEKNSTKAQEFPTVATDKSKDDDPARSLSPMTVPVVVRVVGTDGKAIADAAIATGIVTTNSSGFRSPNLIFAHLGEGGRSKSDSDGLAMTDIRLTEDTPEDAEFEIAAFHPELGSAHAFGKLSSLTAGDRVELKVELGDVIRGRVVDTNGDPVAGVKVEVSTGSPANAVNMTGLALRTREDGSFAIPGVRYENTPHEILAHSSQISNRGYAIVTDTINGKAGLPAKSYKPDDRMWDAGTIVVERNEIVQLTSAGERGFIPSAPPPKPSND